MGLGTAFGQHDMVLPPPLIQKDKMDVFSASHSYSLYYLESFKPFTWYGGAYSLGGRVTQIPPSSLHDGEGSSLPHFVPPNDVVNFKYVVGIKPGNSYAWSWWIYLLLVGRAFCCLTTHFLWIHGQGLTLTHLIHEPGCEDYSYLDQAVTDFEHGLQSIPTDSIETLKMHASFDEPDTRTYSVLS